MKDVRMRGFQDRADLDDTTSLLDERVAPLPPELVALQVAAGRVLAKDLHADIAVPGFDRAAMDGYALRGAETFGAGAYNPLEFPVIGVSLPGRPFLGHVAPGQAVRIMTGAPLPDGADAVVPVEVTEQTKDSIRILEAIPPGRHVGHVGEDIAPGTLVLRLGRVLRPQDVAVLASLGAVPVSVHRRPRVAIIITGDELLPAGSKPQGCHIVDSNSVMLDALVRRDGGMPETLPLVPDNQESLRSILLNTDAEVLLVSGGSSVGQEDHAPRLVAELGELSVHGLALRPASPAGVGFLGGRPVFLLPGNPVSCLCAYDLLAGRAVRRLGGRQTALPYRSMTLPLARKIASPVGRVDYVRVTIQEGQVEPLATSGASILSSTTRADGFVLIRRDSEGAAPGESVTVYLYDGM